LTTNETNEAKTALLSVLRHLPGRGYLVGRCSMGRGKYLKERLRVRVSQDAKGTWRVRIGDYVCRHVVISAQHPSGKVQGDRRLRESEAIKAMDLRWSKALLAAFAHPEMFDSSCYTSPQSIEVSLWDRSQVQSEDNAEEPVAFTYIVMVYWQKDSQDYLIRKFEVSSDFEVLAVEYSGMCPMCRHPIDNLPTGACTGVWHGRKADGTKTGGTKLRIKCPHCAARLMSMDTFFERVGTTGLFWWA